MAGYRQEHACNGRRKEKPLLVNGKETQCSIPTATNPFVAGLFPTPVACGNVPSPFAALTGATEVTSLFGSSACNGRTGVFATALPSKVVADKEAAAARGLDTKSATTSGLDIPVPDDEDDMALQQRSALASECKQVLTSDIVEAGSHDCALAKILRIELRDADSNGKVAKVLGGVDVPADLDSWTLADVRTSIVTDDIQGVPKAFHFIVDSVPISQRQEARRCAGECLPQVRIASDLTAADITNAETYDISEVTDIESEYSNWDVIPVTSATPSTT